LNLRVGSDVESPQTDTFTQGQRDVRRPKIETPGRQQQGDGREVLIVVAQHQYFLAAAAVRVQGLRQMSDGEGLFADLRDGRRLRRPGRPRLNRLLVRRASDDPVDRVSGNESGQRRVRVALGFAQLEAHGQDHVSSLAETGGQDGVGVEGLAGLLELTAEGGNTHTCRRVDGA